ncbi:class I SAM-dependent methyltransferase [Metabacillus fastidiosus]|uniref:class I SAM-dependent methyltransferase n=1 Tax=Metabacillus fastidiosus TaxID=1458 RepID=UPI002E1BCA77|nr:class I SAM-dependent methyltransferase [Metabacillus fastidiosus]
MDYLNALSLLGVSGAHPGGLGLTKAIFESELFPDSSKILDVGCGTGQTVYFLSQLGYDVTGIDYDETMVKKAVKRNKELNIVKGSIENPPFLKDSFHIILCESSLSFTKLSRSVSEIYRILKNDGIVIAIEVVKEKNLSKAEENELKQFYRFTNIYTQEEWKQVFMQSGFKNIKISSEDDYIIDLDEPVTELFPSNKIPSECFDLLNKHEELTEKYANKLSYRIFHLYK